VRGDEAHFLKHVTIAFTSILEKIVQQRKEEAFTSICPRKPCRFTVFKVPFHELTANTHSNLVPSSRRFTNMDNIAGSCANIYPLMKIC